MTDGLAAVLFDMDGLLVDTEPLWFETETEVMARLGAPWSKEDQEQERTSDQQSSHHADLPDRGTGEMKSPPPHAERRPGWNEIMRVQAPTLRV